MTTAFQTSVPHKSFGGNQLPSPIAMPAAPSLSNREIEVLLHWIRADTKATVGAALYISIGTVNTHLARIRAKYDAVGRHAPTKASLLARALQDGLLDVDDL